MMNQSSTWLKGLYYRRTICQLLPLSLLYCILASPCIAELPQQIKKVLVIPSYNFNYSGSQWFLKGVMAEFAEHAPFKANLLLENLQLASKATDQQHQNDMAASLKIKYSHEKPDLIIVQYKQALEFMVSYGQEIFGKVPVVFAGLTTEGGYSEIELPGNFTGITASLSSRNNIELILQNHPKVKKIYVIGGSSPIEQDLVNKAINEGKEQHSNVEFHPLTNFTYPDLLARLKKIGDDSVILYQMLLVDAAGKTFVPAVAAAEIARSACVPVYGMLDTYMGSGITGGYLILHESMGKRAVEIATQILIGKGMPTIQIISESIASYRFDWRQLKRWGINEKTLPGWEYHRIQRIQYLGNLSMGNLWRDLSYRVAGFSDCGTGDKPIPPNKGGGGASRERKKIPFDRGKHG